VSLAGPAACVQAHVVTHAPAPAPVDTLTLVLDFASGASGVACGVRTTPQYWRVHVFGDRGSAEAIGATQLTVRRIDAEPQQLRFEPVDTLRLELEAFADAVAGVAPYPITAPEMVDGVAALEAAIASFRSGQPVAVPR
jgi:predicted dehydrogenase